jgi:hypothetical protein
VSSCLRRMVVFAAPFSQVSGHLLPSQAGELNPLPVDQGLTSAPTVERDLGKRAAAQRFAVVC